MRQERRLSSGQPYEGCEYQRQLYRPLLLAAIVALSGCATLDAKVAIPVSCIKSEPPAMPQTVSEAEILAMDDFSATLTVYTERLLLKAWGVKAESLLQACR